MGIRRPFTLETYHEFLFDRDSFVAIMDYPFSWRIDNKKIAAGAVIYLIKTINHLLRKIRKPKAIFEKEAALIPALKSFRIAVGVFISTYFDFEYCKLKKPGKPTSRCILLFNL